MTGTITITAELAEISRNQLQDKLAAWIMTLLEYDGFREWKNRNLQQQILFSVLPSHEIEETGEFLFAPEVQKHATLVSNYYSTISAAHSVRQAEKYFRTYPFRKGEVSREDHLKTCCELLFSRIYHFRERFLKLLVKLDRITSPRKTLPIDDIKSDFDKRFATFLEQRHSINHHTGYSDIELGAIGLTDLLASVDDEFEWIRSQRKTYRSVASSWAKKTLSAADQLDVYVGLAAGLMLSRCKFLPPAAGRGVDRSNAKSGS